MQTLVMIKITTIYLLVSYFKLLYDRHVSEPLLRHISFQEKLFYS